MKKITELTAELAAPVIAEQGCTLWDVEYVKEAGTWYLRVLLDKEGGGDILDCEAISRKLSDLLDEADPIEGSYTLEAVSYTHLEDLWRLRGAKYVQSDLGKTFREIREALKKRPVLFSGTPCQVDGLYRFLGGKPENLTTCCLLYTSRCV